MASNCPKHHNRFAYRSVSVFSGEPNGFKRAPVRRTRPAPALVSVFSGEPNGFKLLVTNHEPCTTVVSVFSGEPNGFKHDAVGPGAEINRVSVFSGEPNGFKPIRAAHHDASKLCFSVLWRTEWLQTIERGGLISGGTLFQCSLANRMASKLKHLQMGVCMSCFSVLWRTEWLQTVRRRRQSRLGRGVSVFSGEPNGFKPRLGSQQLALFEGFSVLWRTEWLQTPPDTVTTTTDSQFQCSLANRMASNDGLLPKPQCVFEFQCSLANRMASNSPEPAWEAVVAVVSVFSGEPNGFKQ